MRRIPKSAHYAFGNPPYDCIGYWRER